MFTATKVPPYLCRIVIQITGLPTIITGPDYNPENLKTMTRANGKKMHSSDYPPGYRNLNTEHKLN